GTRESEASVGQMGRGPRSQWPGTARGRQESGRQVAISMGGSRGVSRWRRALDRVIGAERAICATILVGMTAMVTLEVLLRSFFNPSLGFADEIAAYLLVAMTFLGISISHHEDAHFRIGLLYDRFPTALRTYIDLVWDLLALGFAVIVTYYLVLQV